MNCWGRLVTGVGAGLGKGDSVIVVGYVYTSEYEDRDGNRRSSLEIRATSVGPDLARCIVRVEQRRHPGASSTGGEVAGPAVADAAGSDREDSHSDTEIADGESVRQEPGLPLTA